MKRTKKDLTTKICSGDCISFSTLSTMILSILFGCVITTTILLNYQFHFSSRFYDDIAMPMKERQHYHRVQGARNDKSLDRVVSTKTQRDASSYKDQQQDGVSVIINHTINRNEEVPFEMHAILYNLNVLVVIASYDFSQLPHLEEVLSSYHDVCLMGVNRIDIHIHATIAYPVTLIDMINSRIVCKAMSIRIVVKPKSLRLHLVDCHRRTFYENLPLYDLFIYTEDDIRITPTTVASYLYETKYIEFMLSTDIKKKTYIGEYKPSDFNVGIVRYEYNYPSNVIIDDNTRHATQNVTRVYWEHSGKYDKLDGVVPHAIHSLPQSKKESNILNQRYVTMKNHHQGMYLATRNLLMEWDARPGCNFSDARERPGKKNQPSQGTQRVWMSSQMLYGKMHCNVQQLLPVDTFSSLTVLHIPNKNYRRVGKYQNRTFSDGTEVFTKPHDTLLTEMQLHIALKKYKQSWTKSSSNIYTGSVTMIDEVDTEEDRTSMLDLRMEDYRQYIGRGGLLTEDDMMKIDLADVL